MKTHTIKTPTAELMILEVPNLESTLDILMAINSETEGYTLLGKPDEVKEEDAKELVESNPIFGEEYRGMYHVYPKESKLFTASSVISLLSLLESEIYWDVNPIKKPNGEDYYYEENHGFDGVETLWDGGSYNEDLGQFEEAESRTFDRNRTLIFVKQ